MTNDKSVRTKALCSYCVLFNYLHVTFNVHDVTTVDWLLWFEYFMPSTAAGQSKRISELMVTNRYKGLSLS